MKPPFDRNCSVEKVKRRRELPAPRFGRPAPNVAAAFLSYPVNVKIVVGGDQDLWGNGFGGSNLTSVTCGIFTCATVRKSGNGNCNEIWVFCSGVTNVSEDPDDSVFRVFLTRLQVSCVR